MEEDYDDYIGEEGECFICHGEGYTEGEIPFWDEGDLVICYSCLGSGLRKDMTCY